MSSIYFRHISSRCASVSLFVIAGIIRETQPHVPRHIHGWIYMSIVREFCLCHSASGGIRLDWNLWLRRTNSSFRIASPFCTSVECIRYRSWTIPRLSLCHSRSRALFTEWWVFTLARRVRLNLSLSFSPRSHFIPFFRVDAIVPPASLYGIKYQAARHNVTHLRVAARDSLHYSPLLPFFARGASFWWSCRDHVRSSQPPAITFCAILCQKLRYAPRLSFFLNAVLI